MKSIILWLLFSTCAFAASDDGLISIESTHSFQKTVKKLETILKNKGFTIFAKVDHRKNASLVKRNLKQSTVFIFGNPNVGTPLMKASPSFAIDLPVKILIHKNDDKVTIVYNDPLYLAKRHGVKSDFPQILKMSGALKKISSKVAN